MAHGWTVVCQAAFVDYVSIVTRRHVHRRALRDRGTLVYAATSPEPVNSTPPHAIRTKRPNQSQTDVRTTFGLVLGRPTCRGRATRRHPRRG